MMKRFICTILLVSAVTGCGRDTENTEETSRPTASSVTVTLPNDIVWLNTGIVLQPGEHYTISPKPAQVEEALGFLEANFDAPVPTAGSFGLIARIGQNGLPLAVGESLALQSSSHTWGESLYIGRNGSLADFGASSAATEETEVALADLDVTIATRPTDSPAPLSPVPNFFTENATPTFNWDDVENAFKYTFELSRFPDFRELVLSLEPSASNVSLAGLGNAGQPLFPGEEDTSSASLTEGVYYWRLRAQVNECRTIAPCFKWTDHSVVYRMGVEERETLPSPTILSPSEGGRFDAGQILFLEIAQTEDASGLFWRYRHYHGACGAELSAGSATPRETSPWLVFVGEYATNNIGQAPQRYGAVRLQDLDNGSHLFLVQTIDGADGRPTDLSRAGENEVRFRVGCGG